MNLIRSTVMKLLKLIILGVAYGVAQINEELGEASLRSRIVSENVGEGGISKGLREALAEGLTGSVIVAQSDHLLANGPTRGMLGHQEQT